ncbi:MAG: hypothetical protein H5T76_38285, partial [Streptomyces sp.]|nr:hypothetical protein [Streptomyces sp.]
QQGDALGSKGRPADPAVCQPIEDIRLRSPEPAPVAAAARPVHPETDPGAATTIELYDPEESGRHPYPPGSGRRPLQCRRATCTC